MKILNFFILILLSFQLNAQQSKDVQYVTGKLYLTLYTQADSGSKQIRMLVTGEKLFVEEISGSYARIETINGQTGWVKKGFLVKTKPATLLYDEIKKTNNKMKKELIELKDKITNNSTAKEEELNKKIKELLKQNKNLKLKNQEYKQNNSIKATEQKNLKIIVSKEKTKITTDDKKAVNNIKINDNVQLLNIIKDKIAYIIAAFLLVLLIGFRIGSYLKESELVKHFGGVKVW